MCQLRSGICFVIASRRKGSRPSTRRVMRLTVVVHAGHCATVAGVSQFNRVSRSSSTCDACTEAKDESTANILSRVVCSRLYSSTNDDQRATNEDADSTTVTVRKESTEGERGDLSAVVDDEDDASAATFTTETECFLVALHCIDGAHQGRVVAVQSGDEVTDG
jgi:hypothetical protein